MQPRDSVHYNQCGKCMAQSEKVSRTCACASSHLCVSPPSSTPTHHCCCCFEEFWQHAPEASAQAAGQTHSSCHRSKRFTLPAASRLLASKNHHPGPLVADEGHTTLLLLPHPRQERAAHCSSPRCDKYDESCCAHRVCLGDTLVVCGRVGWWITRLKPPPPLRPAWLLATRPSERATLANKHAQPAAPQSSRQPVHGPPAAPCVLQYKVCMQTPCRLWPP